MRWVQMLTGVVVGAGLCMLTILMSRGETVCGDGSYGTGALVDEQQWWPLPVARCTTGTVGGPSDSTIIVGWGSALTLVLGAALVAVSVLAFRRESTGRASAALQ